MAISTKKELKEYRRLLKSRYRTLERAIENYTVWQRFVISFKLLCKRPLSGKEVDKGKEVEKKAQLVAA